MTMLTPAAAGARAPAPTFFGVAPQTQLTAKDTAYMRAGGIGSVRIAVDWALVQPTAAGGYDWSQIDEAVALTARAGLRLLPSVYGTPHWLAGRQTALPVSNARQRAAWSAFLRALVARYGPGGEFWNLHATEGPNYEPAIASPMPIRSWQIWNEANFHYFAYPVSPHAYGRLLRISSRTIKAADPVAKVVLSGLFGRPTAGGSRGMDASRFLRTLYRIPGIARSFDGIALHPYAVDAETLEEIVEEFHDVTVESHDRVPLYVTEMGWGSQNNFAYDAFEQGVRGQVRQLRASYRYLIANRGRLDLKGTYWYSWKDNPAYVACDFCDSVGLFRAGAGFRPKPAWHAFVALSGGRARP